MNRQSLITLQEAKRRLKYRRGWRSLLYQLEVHEQQKGVELVVRRRGKRLTRYLVTVESIAAHAPNLLPSDGDAEEKSAVRHVGDVLALLDERIEEVCIDIIERRVMRRLLKLEQNVPVQKSGK